MKGQSIPIPPAQPDDPAIAAMTPLSSVFRRYLKSRNLKYTPERADILEAIIERDSVFEVDDLMLDVRDAGHGASMATIYRTIKLLQEAGIITPALFDSKQTHYQLVYGKAPCDYMVCMKTGQIIEFSADELATIRKRICEQYGWESVGHRFQIYALSPQGRKMIAEQGDDED